MKQKDDRERIIEFLSFVKLSKNKAGLSIGDKNGMRFQYVENGRNGISEKLASDIVKIYPEISYNWLAHGIGEMLVPKNKAYTSLENNPSVVNETAASYLTGNNEKYLIELIETQKKMIEKLEKEIEDLREVTRESSKINK